VAISNKDRLQLVFLLHRSLMIQLACIYHRINISNHHTVMRWLDLVDHHILAIDNENHFYNINTPEQINS